MQGSVRAGITLPWRGEQHKDSPGAHQQPKESAAKEDSARAGYRVPKASNNQGDSGLQTVNLEQVIALRPKKLCQPGFLKTPGYCAVSGLAARFITEPLSPATTPGTASSENLSVEITGRSSDKRIPL